MEITAKKFTQKGSDRFGSAIFIDDLKEERIDSLTGEHRNQSVLIAMLVLVISKFLSANIFGIIITIPVYLLIYFLGTKKVSLRYTTHRVLVENEYNLPQITKFLGFTLQFISIYVLLRLLFPDNVISLEFRIAKMGSLFQFFNLYDNRFFLYRRYVLQSFTFTNSFDSFLTIMISLWFSYQFIWISYEFTEINLTHISEQLIRLRKMNTLTSIMLLIAIYSFLQFVLFIRFSFLFLLMVIVVYQRLPRQPKITLSLIGPSNRVFLRNITIELDQFSNLSRTTAITFGWTPQIDQESSDFPNNIIAPEVASIFDTGLRSYGHEAFHQSNIIGLIISSMINIVVLISLIRFAIILELDEFDTIFIIFISLVAISTFMFVLLELFNRIRAQVNTNEQLFIGEGFVARSLSNSLWILKGSSLEGTTVQRGSNKSLIRYDKAKGMSIQWERFTLLFVISTIVILIGIWNYLGAINLQKVPLVLPSLIDFGFEFIEQKAQTELEFFIISSYVIWIIIIWLYPRYYTRTRPSLFLDMEYASIEPIILKDFDEHQDASVQFTKSLLYAAKDRRKSDEQRPGTFLLDLFVRGQVGTGTQLIFLAGENQQLSVLDLPLYGNNLIYHNIGTSALHGYPKLDLRIELRNSINIVYVTNKTINILYGKSTKVDIELGSYGTLKFEMRINRQKS